MPIKQNCEKYFTNYVTDKIIISAQIREEECLPQK